MSLRLVPALLLSLLLVLTGQGAAVARGAPLPAGMAELCTGSGPVMVAVDAQGRPVGPQVLCPDLAAMLAKPVAPPVTIAAPRRARRIVLPHPVAARPVPVAPVEMRTRGPPERNAV